MLLLLQRKVEIYCQYIGPGCTRSAVDLKRYSNISQVYRGWLHSLGTRSAIGLLKVFTTTDYMERFEQREKKRSKKKDYTIEMRMTIKPFLSFLRQPSAFKS